MNEQEAREKAKQRTHETAMERFRVGNEDLTPVIQAARFGFEEGWNARGNATEPQTADSNDTEAAEAKAAHRELERRAYETWKRQVDEYIKTLCGMDADDLPDFRYADDFAEGRTPIATAKRVIRYAHHGIDAGIAQSRQLAERLADAEAIVRHAESIARDPGSQMYLLLQEYKAKYAGTKEGE